MNRKAAVLLCSGAFVGGTVGVLSVSWGGSFWVWFTFVMFEVAAVLDGVMRLGQLGSGGRDASTILSSSGGGHLLLVPLWLSGSILALLVAVPTWLS